MRTVGAYEAKTHLGQLLDDVEQGETIMITRHGVPVAVLSPPAVTTLESRRRAIAEFRRYRDARNLSLGGLSLRDMIEEGRP